MSKEQPGPIEQEQKKGHKLLSLGHDTYAEVSSFKGKTYVGIRRWFQADDGTWYRTKNGINMVLAEFKEVLGNMAALNDFLDAEAKKPYSDEAKDERPVQDRGW